MRRGTRVGNAYVNITADGDGINEEIVDSVDDAGPGVRKAGKEHGEAYGEEFGDSLMPTFSHAADKAGAEFNRRMADSADDGADDYGDRFEKTMRKAAKRIGRNVGEAIGKHMSENMFDTFNQMLSLMESRLDKVSGNAGSGGSSGGSGGSTGAGTQQPGSKQTLYKDYDFFTMFESARVKLHAASNDAIEKDDKALLKSQKTIYDAVLKMEEKKSEFIAKFEGARKKLHEQSNAAILKDDEQLVKDQQKLFARLEKEANARLRDDAAREKARASFVQKFLDRRETMQEKSNAAILKDDQQLVKDQQKLFDQLKRADDALWTQRRASAAAHIKYLADLEKGRIDSEGNTLSRATQRKKQKSIGDTIGGLLGAGSRSESLNILGRSIGGIVNLTDKARRGAVNMFDTFVTGFKEAGEGASIFARLSGGGGAVGARISAGFSSVAKAGPAAAVAIVVVVAAMSALVSVASALLAILTALTATIVSALTGAMLVLGAAIMTAVVAGGLLTAAFMSMNDAQKDLLSASFSPLKDQLTEIGQLMITQMIPYFDRWADNLSSAIGLLGPVAKVMGDAFGQAGARLTASLSGPGFQRFFTMMAEELPTITRRMSGALGGFLNGLMGVFAAITPQVSIFAGYLNRAAEKFSEWANSAGGQNAIADFVDRAVNALKSLWGFIKETGGLIADVLFNEDAQNAGNSMFDTAKKKIEEWRDAIAKAAKDGRLKKWFDDAREFGAKLVKVVGSLMGTLEELNNSGVLEAVGTGLEGISGFIKDANRVLGPLVDYLGVVLPEAVSAAQSALNAFTLGGLIGQISGAAGAMQNLINLANKVPGVNIGGGPSTAGSGSGGSGGGSWGSDDERRAAQRVLGSTLLERRARTSGGGKDGVINTVDEMLRGKAGALGGSDPVSGNDRSRRGGGDNKKWRNPYVKWAKSLIDEGPTLAQELKRALTSMIKQVDRSLDNAAKALDTQQARDILTSQMNALRSAARSGVDSAQSALNTAAQSLASADSRKEASRALKQVKNAQKNMRLALDNQKDMNKMAAALSKQRITSPENVRALMDGLKVQNATLADFAEARSRVAEKIVEANAKLGEAIQMRDSYTAQVSSAVRSFGDLTTAQASVIDGIEQTLSAKDITSNLEDRLARIKAFQDNLRILLAQGLSNEAYKQIVDAGVEGGSAYAQALVAGGGGAIGIVNGLVGQIGSIADQMGLEAGSRMYQAGVDAAQGLVDGLESLSAKLDSAAARLGDSIARAIKRSLGIKSPSTVMFGLMGDVGDGMSQGLDAQHVKVGSAAARLASQVAVSPEVAAYAARQSSDPTVSGNGEKFVWNGDMVTPTEDPVAVVHEVVNEITGRLL